MLNVSLIAISVLFSVLVPLCFTCIGVARLYSLYVNRIFDENTDTTATATNQQQETADTVTEDPTTDADIQQDADIQHQEMAAPTDEPTPHTPFVYENDKLLEKSVNVIITWIHFKNLQQLSSVTNRMAEHQNKSSLSKSILVELLSVHRKSRLQAILDYMNDRSVAYAECTRLARAIANLMVTALDIRLNDIGRLMNNPLLTNLKVTLTQSLLVSRDPFLCDFMLHVLTEESIGGVILSYEQTMENPDHIINYDYKTANFAFIDKFMENKFMAPLPADPKVSLVSRISLLNRIVASFYKRIIGSSPFEKDVQLDLFETFTKDTLNDINHLQADFCWFTGQEDIDAPNSPDDNTSPTNSQYQLDPEDSISNDERPHIHLGPHNAQNRPRRVQIAPTHDVPVSTSTAHHIPTNTNNGNPADAHPVIVIPLSTNSNDDHFPIYTASNFSVPIGARDFTSGASTSGTAAPNTSAAAAVEGSSPPLVFNDDDCEMLDLSDDDRAAHQRLIKDVHPSKATFQTVMDMKAKYHHIENRFKALLAEENKTELFNLMHTLCSMGATLPGVSSRLDHVLKAYKALIKQFQDYQEYIQDYERGFVFYQVFEIVDVFKNEALYEYVQEDMFQRSSTVTDQAAKNRMAQLERLIHKTIILVFSFESIFEKYVACSSVFKDEIKQREFRDVIRVLANECYEYGEAYKALERAFKARVEQNEQNEQIDMDELIRLHDALPLDAFMQPR